MFLKKRHKKLKIFENGKSFLDGIKTFFIILEMLFFGKIQKDRGYKLKDSPNFLPKPTFEKASSK